MKKLINIISLITLLVFVSSLVPAPMLAQEGVSCESDVVVQAEDSLSSIANKVYGDPLAFPVIAEATNSKAASDSSYAKIENVNVIEPGWKLCIPAAAEAQASLGAASEALGGKAPAVKGGEGHFGYASGSLDHLDPALWYFAATFNLAFGTCTTLVTFPDIEGSSGAQVKDGLADMPQISADKLSYTFTLKPGLKFANGNPITGADIKATFERLFAPDLASPATGFFKDIVGAEDFAAGNAKEISGIKVDGNTITFQLTKPVGSFLYRMTMPFTCPVPAGTPATAIEDGSLLQTGPYMVESYEPSRSLVLVRNPNYNAEVLGDRGKLDKITMDIGIDPAQAGLLIRAGQLDLYLEALAPADAAQALSDPSLNGRAFANPIPQVLYLWLNNDVPPFDNVKVRQAVNYAINRNAILRVWGGPSQGVVTDQILPPTMPGWQDADIYPMDGDVAQAKQLLADSGITLPVETTLRTINDGAGFVEVAQAIQAQLKEVGINVNIETSPNSVNEPIITTPANKVPMGINTWTQDYPDPDNFIDTLLNGDRITETNNQNKASFNNPEINAEMAKLVGTIGAERSELYNALDAKIIGEYAPWAPILNGAKVDIVSERVTGYLYHPVYGVDWSAMGVKQ